MNLPNQHQLKREVEALINLSAALSVLAFRSIQSTSALTKARDDLIANLMKNNRLSPEEIQQYLAYNEQLYLKSPEARRRASSN